MTCPATSFRRRSPMGWRYRGHAHLARPVTSICAFSLSSRHPPAVSQQTRQIKDNQPLVPQHDIHHGQRDHFYRHARRTKGSRRLYRTAPWKRLQALL
ncbi:hypothetical protein BO82DRAFT_94538 [Aspergillus uvarum CBS 121591]|uniref:Uncharacterized protein n=1 Tax=Aspergillus uvarum CBS 121591 TaxID=1448315 RepID=A0A319CB85_9EURO|nr:hypothetical protein BO82DRAFT_94538 [Aspergillus uvarum CBS 121591]PYH81071.1 hypothetical protein BO82DRAFT_94538 [Aspergillus uvarum CBS 121591]